MYHPASMYPARRHDDADPVTPKTMTQVGTSASDAFGRGSRLLNVI